VTIYLIEVRAVSKQYDMQAQKLAREIRLLPTTRFLSLAAIIASSIPLTIHTSQLYYLAGNPASFEIDRLVRQLFVDPVVQ